MEVLIPLLSKNENSAEFLDASLNGADSATVLLVIDKNSPHMEYGYGTSQISQGSSLMEEVKAEAEKRVGSCESILEWGSTEAKVINAAKMRKGRIVALMRSEHAEFERLVGILKKARIRVRVI